MKVSRTDNVGNSSFSDEGATRHFVLKGAVVLLIRSFKVLHLKAWAPSTSYKFQMYRSFDLVALVSIDC